MGSLQILLLALLAFVNSNVYNSVTFWSEADCTGTFLGWGSASENATCSSYDPICTNVNLGDAQSTTAQCSDELPSIPSNILGVKVWDSSDSCSGDPDSIIGYAERCIRFGDDQPYTGASCSAGGMTEYVWDIDKTCSDQPISAEYSGGCISAGGGSSAAGFGCSCFHEETIITYKGKEHKMAALASHSECVIPHVVDKNGVRISTTCPGDLRLTADHLVHTESGYVKAGDLKVGDEIFKSSQGCKITQIDIETNQKYFGLNCIESEVLADGYKTSTFGHYHSVPSTWMRFVSSVVGISTASAWGDSLATLASKLGLLD